MMARLNDIISREKQPILMTPHIRVEIDYIVKDMNRLREQVRPGGIRQMVACKILQEAALLYGSETFF